MFEGWRAFAASAVVVLAPAAHAAAVRDDFLWGTATAAYQVEGYRLADGRQPSIWDAFDTDGASAGIAAITPHGRPRVHNGESGQFADGDYVRFRDTAQLIADGGFGVVRMSISWPRVMTYSLAAGGVTWTRNEAGIQHYRDILAEYRARGLQVALTMFHWDLPLLLEEVAMKKNSSFWLQHDWAPGVFWAYAQLLLTEFKDFVSWWITINEPHSIVAGGYAKGSNAPGRCSDRGTCYQGNSSTEPYSVAKGLLLGHARAFRAWVDAGMPGKGCGITLNADWRLPFTDSMADRAAAERELEWHAAIFADPIHRGEWPRSIVERVGGRLPRWSPAEIALVNGSHDGLFFMNHYSTLYTREDTSSSAGRCGFECDSLAQTSGYNFTSGQPVGTPSSTGWLFNYGPGLGRLIAWYNRRYPGLVFFITENGWGEAGTTKDNDILDLERCNYFRDYLGNLSALAVAEGYQVVGFTAWSIMDNFEWAQGYLTRFGLTYVDYDTMKRTPKFSFFWFKTHVAPLKQLPSDGKPFPPCDPSAVPLWQPGAVDSDARAQTTAINI